jgi:hypothetical protein
MLIILPKKFLAVLAKRLINLPKGDFTTLRK